MKSHFAHSALTCAILLILATSLLRADPPNILIFFSDDHTNQAISAYQNLPNPAPQDALFKDWAPAQTPNIDRLADQGAIFRNSYVCNSICGPSRANLLTGLHSHANGFLSNENSFDGSQQTFPKLLQAAGYNTSIFGKWHLGSTPTGFDHFEYQTGQGVYYSPTFQTSPNGGASTSAVAYPGQYIADVTTDRAIAWLQERMDNSATEPFLMFVNHKGTHRSWQPGPQETDPAVFRQVEWDYSVLPNPDTAPGDPASWTPASVPVPTNFYDGQTQYATRAAGAGLARMDVSSLSQDSDLKLPGSSFGGTAYDEVRTWYAANGGGAVYKQQRYLKDYMLTGRSVDRSVGEVLDFLEANELDHNTIVIYASDQGFFLGEHGWFDKRWMYHESFRTPMIVQWKDAAGNSLVTPGSVIDEMVQVMDIGPTALAAAGVTPATPMHGESFLGILSADTGDDPATWRDSLYYHYHMGTGNQHNVVKHYGVFNGRYKLINHYQLNSAQQWELFDLENDPLEMNNLLYNATTGVIDNPEDGIEGDAAFQTLVTGLMTELADLRTQYGDATGASFTLPGSGDTGGGGGTGGETNLVVNGSFETNSGANTAFDGWIIVSTSGGSNWDAEPSRGSIANGQDGNWFAIAEDTAGTGSTDVSYFYQTLPTVAGTTYDLSFYVARPNNVGDRDIVLDVDVFDGAADPGGIANSGGLLDARIVGSTDGVPASTAGSWVLFEYQFTATSSQSTLRFLDTDQAPGGGTSGIDPAIDNVVVTAASDPALTGFSYDSSTGACAVSLVGAANTAYILVEADDLDFGNPDQSPVPLAGAAATVGSINGDTIVTDANGNATVEGVVLGNTKSASFVRAETAP